MVDENQDLFTTLYAQRLFFLVTTELKVLKFQPIGRTEARMMLENRLRTLRRSGQFSGVRATSECISNAHSNE